MTYQPNDRVIIRSNPHDTEHVNIVGTVVRLGESCGVPLVYVEVPEGGRNYPSGGYPLATVLVEPADHAHLIALAEGYEQKAAELRRLADEE